MTSPPESNQNITYLFETLLQHNKHGTIENPLRRIDDHHLEEDIRNFHKDEGFDDVVGVDLLIRASHLARDEDGFKQREDLTELENAALEKEKTSKLWQESKELSSILLTCFVASIVQGWAQGAIIGANQSWPDELHLHTGLTAASKDKGNIGDIWRFSATNAILYFSASTLGAFLCEPLTELFWGRRGALFVAAVLIFTASVGAAYTKTWQALLATRITLGIGMGAATSVVPVYESEVSPARLRGLSILAPNLTRRRTDPCRQISRFMADWNGLGNSIFCCDSAYTTTQLAFPNFELIYTLRSASILGLCWI